LEPSVVAAAPYLALSTSRVPLFDNAPVPVYTCGSVGFQQAQGYCYRCAGPVLIGRRTPSHALHAVLTLLLCGLWAFVWAFLTAFSGAWRCQTCGGSKLKGRPTNLAAVAILAIGVFALIILVVFVRGALQPPSPVAPPARRAPATKSAPRPQETAPEPENTNTNVMEESRPENKNSTDAPPRP
jgi:hypothetical protein